MKSENVKWRERKDKGLHMDSAIEIPSLLWPPDYLLFIYLLLQPSFTHLLNGQYSESIQ